MAVKNEIKLIIECSQTNIDESSAGKILDLLKGDLNWEYVIAIADRNCVLPILSWNLLESYPSQLPAKIKVHLSEYLQQHSRKNLFLTLKLVEIVSVLRKEGISSLPFKGPLLAQQAYGNLSLRQFVDLDILVKPRDFDHAIQVLVSNGYIPVSQTSWLRRKVLFFTHRIDVVLVSPDRAVQIELHWKLSYFHFALPLQINQLWSRLEQVKLGGKEINSLPFGDSLIYLCLHGSRHLWQRLEWISDVNELVRSQQKSAHDTDWNSIREHARRHESERVLEFGLFLIHKYFSTRTPYPDFDKVEQSVEYEELAKQVGNKIFAETLTLSPKSERYLYYLQLKERRGQRLTLYFFYISYYLKLLFRTSSEDRSVFQLPNYFYPFYYILRPLRLFLRYSGLKEPKKIHLRDR